MFKKGLILFFIAISSLLFGSSLDNYRQGMKYLDLDKTASIKKAIIFFEKAIKGNQYYFKAYRGLGIAYYKIDEFYLAKKQLKKALKFNRNNLETNLYYARTLIALGKFSESKKYINFVLSLRPRDTRALFIDSIYYYHIDRSDLALKRLEAVLALRPTYFRAFIRRGIILEEMRRYSEAEKNFLKASFYNATSPLTHYYLANFYYNRGNIEKAAKSITISLRLDPNYTKSIKIKGRILYLKGKWLEAATAYKYLLEKYPYNHIYCYVLGMIYSKISKVDNSYFIKAINQFQKGLKLKNNDEVVRYAMEEFLIKNAPIKSKLRKKLSMYHIRIGDRFSESNLYYRAEVAYRRAIRIYPVSIVARKKNALLQRRLKRWEQFYKDLKIIKSLDFSNVSLSDKLVFYKKVVARLLSRKEGLNQFSVIQSIPKVIVFNLFSLYNKRHLYFDIKDTYGAIFRDALQPLKKIKLIRLKNNRPKSIYAARKIAKKNGADYYIHGNYIKSVGFTVFEIFLRDSRTGRVVWKKRLSRRGNRRLFNLATVLGESLENDIPLIGRIIKLDGDKVIINLGKTQGIKSGDIFKIALSPQFRVRYIQAFGKVRNFKTSGKIKILRVDERIATGEIIAKQTFDSITLYQYLVKQIKKKTIKKAQVGTN